MPYSIDRQIQTVEERIQKERAKLSELKKKKKQMLVNATAFSHKKEITELVNAGKTTEEILSIFNGK